MFQSFFIMFKKAWNISNDDPLINRNSYGYYIFRVKAHKKADKMV